MRTYLGVRHAMGTCVAETIDRETHTRLWLGTFHTSELAAMDYDRRQVCYHNAATRLNFPFGMAPIHLVPPESGVVSLAMARDDREVRECLEVEDSDEAYMQELRRHHPELVEAEGMIFADAGVEVVVISFSDEEAKRRAARMRRSASMSGGVSSPMTKTMILARTQIAAHRT
ncbi:Bifunctional dihydroflavonol 4-reductase/flavanone 4-reductase [Hordeum vulgare]|nr:Bifunctional dihydroflavonol 4-reductase/flavanone 4-reductase [Hordeum vulgare]